MVRRFTREHTVTDVSGAVRGHAVGRPSATALHDLSTGRRIDFSELDRLTDATCHFLASIGLRAGDTVSLVADNSIAFCLLYLASLRAGTVLNPHPYVFIASEIADDMKPLRPAAALVARSRLAEFDGRCGGAAVVGLESGTGFIEQVGPFLARGPYPDASGATAACVYPSCGSESDPRGIVYTHANLAALIPSICRAFRFSARDVHLVVLPLAHTAALNYSLLPAWLCGATVVLAPGFWPIRSDFWSLVASLGVSYVQVVPTILVMLMHLPAAPRDRLALGYVGCGLAPLPLHVQIGFEEAFGLRVANLYGLSETGPTHVDDPSTPEWRGGSIGTPLDVNEIAFLRPDGQLAADGEPGEIAVRGANVFQGYAVNPQAAVARFARGFFRTGDAGYRDPRDGRHYFTGRTRPLIIKGGINIHPSEVDRVLLAHPDIAASSTSSAPDDYLGEVVTSTVRPRPGAFVTEPALRAYCREHLSPLKVPDVIRIEQE